jgi:tetraacyldisaccharide-1-P 4'-kinase
MKKEHWTACAAEAESCGAEAVVTTEKDAVKIVHTPEFPLAVATQSVEVAEEAEFQRMVQRVVEEN